MCGGMSKLVKLLAKRGYSRLALQSEIVTEDMLDEMFPEVDTKMNSHNHHHSKFDRTDRCIPTYADGKPFDTTPTLVASCN
ncbi:unnamed protein product [Caenorhabditis sp. 36 PRJEB53466]|nr:unnamed protein product [Caenorhabditis sp. 36 PRJEB53466]